MSLKEYIRKRDFKKTAEPGARRGKETRHRFVIQKHHASRLHYDFRLEMDGTLKSWALPKGLPFAYGEKHLAVQVEDHPTGYADFEGVIPKGQYGGGTVMVWDRGTYEPLSKAPSEDLQQGKLHFTLLGEKLRGEWYLVRLRSAENQWLIIKGGDSLKPPSKKADDLSVLSKQTMKQLSRGDRVWLPKKSAPKPIARAGVKAVRAAPLPDFVEPMKAKSAAASPSGDWFYEIKFDGWRALALKGGSQARLISRNEKDLGGKFPEIMESLAQLKAQDAIVDGEIVALDDQGRPSFQLLQGYDIGREKPPLYFYAFDLLRLNGKDLKKLPVEKRKQLLAKLLRKPPGRLRYSASLGGNVEHLLGQARELGLEGLIGKREGSFYESGRRSGAWIKLKLLREQEFVIGGYTDPEGSRQFLGALIVGYYKQKELIFAGKVGTGFNAKLLRSLHAQFKKIPRQVCPFKNLPMPGGGRWGQGMTKTEMKFCHWVKPSMVCQVKFGEWTRDGRLRQPVFLGMREDKAACEVVREKAI